MDNCLASQADYLTDAQLCALLKVGPRTTNEWRRQNLGPVYIRTGLRRILYKRTDVEAWLASRTFKHRAAEVTNHRKAA